MASPRALTIAAALSLSSAFLWATYYFFILALAPAVGPPGLTAYPFLIGGVAYTAYAWRTGEGRTVLELFAEPSAWFRAFLILAMQLSVLASTYAAGAVDTSLLALLGDAAMTPLLAMALLREGRHRARSPLFVGGLALAGGGAALTILASGSAAPFRGWALAVAPVVPIAVGFFYVLSAQAGRRRSIVALVAHSTLLGGLLSLPLAGAIPGGWTGLAVATPVALLLLVGVALTSFFVAPVVYFGAMERAGIVLPALFQTLIPIFTLLLSAVLFDRVPAPLGLAGIPIAMLGGGLAYRGAVTPEKPRPPPPGEPLAASPGRAPEAAGPPDLRTP